MRSQIRSPTPRAGQRLRNEKVDIDLLKADPSPRLIARPEVSSPKRLLQKWYRTKILRTDGEVAICCVFGYREIGVACVDVDCLGAHENESIEMWF
jgi:hypothetical protein